MFFLPHQEKEIFMKYEEENLVLESEENTASIQEAKTEEVSSKGTPKFKDFNFTKSLERALGVIGFEDPTPVQEQAIPELMRSSDIIATAQTGTGKTAAYCLPFLNKLIESPQDSMLILGPTRELIQQIEEFIKTLTKNMDGIRCASITGGVPYGKQFKWLDKNPQIIIATPGRLLDHISKKKIKFNNLKYLVLDEADRMLDMGFERDIEQIIGSLPKQRQCALLSATWDKKIDSIANRYLKNPKKIAIGKTSQAAATIEQKIILSSTVDKRRTLIQELKRRQGAILIFTKTKRLADQTTRALSEEGLDSVSIHGDKSQGQRNKALKIFKRGQCKILVATDVVARGIDVSNIAHVINYNLPRDPEDYIHRIGRTGRAGLKGEAVSIVCPEDYSLWFPILKLLKASSSTIPETPKEMLSASRSSKPAGRGRGGNSRRPSSGGGRRYSRSSEGGNSDRRPTSRFSRSSEGGNSDRRPPSRLSRSSEGRNSDRRPPSRFSRSSEGGNSNRRPPSRFSRPSAPGRPRRPKGSAAPRNRT